MNVVHALLGIWAFGLAACFMVLALVMSAGLLRQRRITDFGVTASVAAITWSMSLAASLYGYWQISIYSGG